MTQQAVLDRVAEDPDGAVKGIAWIRHLEAGSLKRLATREGVALGRVLGLPETEFRQAMEEAGF